MMNGRRSGNDDGTAWWSWIEQGWTAAHNGDWGTMVALHGTKIETVPLASATGELKLVDPARYAEATVFFG